MLTSSFLSSDACLSSHVKSLYAFFLSVPNGVQGTNFATQLNHNEYMPLIQISPAYVQVFIPALNLSPLRAEDVTSKSIKEESKLIFFLFLFQIALQQVPLPDGDIKGKWQSQIVLLLAWYWDRITGWYWTVPLSSHAAFHH